MADDRPWQFKVNNVVIEWPVVSIFSADDGSAVRFMVSDAGSNQIWICRSSSV